MCIRDRFDLETNSTGLELSIRYWIRSLIVPIGILCSLEKSIKSGILAIVPSGLIISQITATSVWPASLHKSIAASVWPALLRTPPSITRKGKMCPGTLKSSHVEFLSKTNKVIEKLQKISSLQKLVILKPEVKNFNINKKNYKKKKFFKKKIKRTKKN